MFYVVYDLTEIAQKVRMDTDKDEKDTKLKGLVPYLLLIGVAGIGYNIYYKYDRYYLGEELVTRQVFIKERPEYIYSEYGTSRYTFKGSNYSCRFWLSEGALMTINSDDNIKKDIETIKPGDTVEIKIRQTDEKKLQDTAARPRVIEILKGNRTIISANQVQREEQKGLFINFGIPILCLLIWVVVQVQRLVRKRNAIT